ncbi:MAG: hypothetical protein HY360_04055, partial [Verrucomicrobia bacterium]|nr:hypothetical protein [Verrucomicrobiota bacterium]
HWRELLALYHPRLSLPCGPYARAYRVDVLGQVSCMRMLMGYIGLSKDCSLAALFDDSHPDAYFHHDQDLPFNWSQAAWLVATRYHVPQDARREFRHRSYPKRVMASNRWESFGLIDRKQQKLISVHGTALPAGEADIVQVQHANWALGYRSYSVFGHSFPIHLHYALTKNLHSMRDVRNILCAVMFHGKPAEWTQDQRGRPIETSNFNHAGKLSVAGRGARLVFEGIALTELAVIPTDECSINTLIPTHFAPVDQVRLNGRFFRGAPIVVHGKTAVIEVGDHGFQYTVEYRFERPTDIRLYRWAKFLRFAGFFYEGELKALPVAELARMRVNGRLWIGARSDAKTPLR